jgi:predicted dithiol-disulfide oxidoreductase (DUF899 family)
MHDAASKSLHDKRFPGEDATYRQARDALLLSEMALRRQVEAVAAQRRALPPGGEAPEDYVFEEGDPARPVRLSELFGDKETLLIYCYMYGPAMERPCPMCSSMLDGLDSQALHITQNVALAVTARSPIERILAFKAERGWRNLRLVSSAQNSFHRDYHGETADGAQWPIMNVFTRKGGHIRHTWSSELAFAPSDPGQNQRHIDPIWPLWNALDLAPEGRGDFYARLTYV